MGSEVEVRLYRAVDGRIKVLRAALGPAGKQIRTVFKVGYKLEGEQHGAD